MISGRFRRRFVDHVELTPHRERASHPFRKPEFPSETCGTADGRDPDINYPVGCGALSACAAGRKGARISASASTSRECPAPPSKVSESYKDSSAARAPLPYAAESVYPSTSPGTTEPHLAAAICMAEAKAFRRARSTSEAPTTTSVAKRRSSPIPAPPFPIESPSRLPGPGSGKD